MTRALLAATLALSATGSVAHGAPPIWVMTQDNDTRSGTTCQVSGYDSVEDAAKAARAYLAVHDHSHPLILPFGKGVSVGNGSREQDFTPDAADCINMQSAMPFGYVLTPMHRADNGK